MGWRDCSVIITWGFERFKGEWGEVVGTTKREDDEKGRIGGGGLYNEVEGYYTTEEGEEGREGRRMRYR